MSKVLNRGPVGTPIDGLTALTFPVLPINYAEDFREIEDAPGKVVYADVTSAQEQPATYRIAQTGRANVYANSSIDPSAFLPNRRGTDTILEAREVWSITDNTDPSLLQLMPARVAITLTLPTHSLITPAVIEGFVGRAVALLFAQGEATSTTGINDLSHGVVKRV